MAFENKWITERDMKKRQTPFWSERARAGKFQTRWSEDERRDMYLMWLGHSADDKSSQNTFLFYRQGQSYEVLVDLVGGEGYQVTNALRTPYTLLSINEFGKDRPPLYPGPSIAESEGVVAGFDEAFQVFQTPQLSAYPSVKRNDRSWSAGWKTAKVVSDRLLFDGNGYVNEPISKEDRKKYKIDYWNERTACPNDTWTINRDREIFLRHKEREREVDIPTNNYFFCWSGYLLHVVVNVVSGGCGLPTWQHYSLESIGDFGACSSRIFPVDLEPKRSELLDDLRWALTAHRGDGVFSESPNFMATFDF